MTLSERIPAAGSAGQLLPSTVAALNTWLTQIQLPGWATSAIEELVTKGAWAELNDRFYRDLEFGTGGMRGRTIGGETTARGTGKPGPHGTPGNASIDTNNLHHL